MKERPILFSGAMVRALLNGSKTQTRRIAKVDSNAHLRASPFVKSGIETPHGYEVKNRYGAVGDQLWVRETWQYYDWTEEGEPCVRFAADNGTHWPKVNNESIADQWEVLSRPDNFDIDNRARDRRWRPSIHIPRWASRIQLEITGVRIERLQEISYEDARAEGIDPTIWPGLLTHGFKLLWERINGSESWEENPWVWVIEFKRIKP